MITTTVKGVEENKELDFPRLMKGKITGIVVLFIKPRKGTVIINGGSYDVGQYEDEFIMSKFEDFKQKLTLTNNK